jgi:hypothetical protein
MERFVFFAAIAFAVIFAVGTLVDGPDFSIDIDHDGGEAAVVDVATGRLEPQAFAGSALRLRHLAATVSVIPEDRTDFLIEIDNPGGAPMPQVSTEGGQVSIDGQLRGRISDCSNGGARLRGYGALSAEQLPRITIRSPMTLVVSRSGAGTTNIGPAQTVDLDLGGCSAVVVGDVTETLNVEIAGSGDVQAGGAGRLEASVAGSGDVVTGAIANGADIEVAGSGTVTIASLTGELSADAAGSGTITIEGGQIADAKIDVAGSGDVDISAPIQSLQTDIIGSGDVTVNGVVGDLQVDIAGSGRVSVERVTGAVERNVWGSGDVHIGE